MGLDAHGRTAGGGERDPLARALGCDDYEVSTGSPVDEPDRFWRAVADDLELELARPWDRVLDDSRGIEWTTWFAGARLNVAHGLRACVGRAHARRERRGLSRRGRRGGEWTFAELSREVVRLAEALAALGVEPGDRVAIYMPMSPDAAVASHACAHLGAVQVPIFRLRRARDRAAAAGLGGEGGADGRLLAPARSAGADARDGRRGAARVAVRRARARVAARTLAWDAELGPGELPALEVDAEHPYLLAYTSGTTGGEGARCTHGGFLVSIARRLPGRHPGRRPRPLRTDMADHGPWTWSAPARSALA